MTQKEKQKNTHRRMPIYQRRYTKRNVSACTVYRWCGGTRTIPHASGKLRWVSYSTTGFGRSGTKLCDVRSQCVREPFSLASSRSPIARQCKRKPLFIIWPFVSVRFFPPATMLRPFVCFVDFAFPHKTVMMTLVYEIAIDLSACNYIGWLFCVLSSGLPAIHLYWKI